MKKILKNLLCVAVAFVCVFGFTACKVKVSDTTVDTSKTLYNGKTTNGGLTVKHDGYLYFINGTKTNDGTSAKKNTRGGICRVKLDDDGNAVKDTYEMVVDNLVGYDNGSLAIFGDFLYFTTPNDDVNYQDTKLYYQTNFMRYDLVNKKSYVLYTTKQNSSSEKISYAYYIVGQDLELLVYETTNSTITSLKIDTNVTTNYVLNDVKSCVFSDNYGTCTTENATVDANNFVYYTKNVDVYEDGRSTGNKVYKVSPNTDNSSIISNSEKSISLLSVRSGKLVYSTTSTSGNDTIVYSQAITNSVDTLDFTGIVSYKTYDNVIFMDNTDGVVSAIAMDSDTNQILYLKADPSNKFEVTPVVINTLQISSSSSSGSSSSSNKVSFVGLAELTEDIKDEENEEGTKESKVTYLIYVYSNTVYKLEVMRDDAVSPLADPVKLTKSTVTAPSGTLVPDVIGNNLYIFAKELDDKNKETSNIYLYQVDLTVKDDSTDYATIIAKKEA